MLRNTASSAPEHLLTAISERPLHCHDQSTSLAQRRHHHYRCPPMPY
jgi:hypothetical protein